MIGGSALSLRIRHRLSEDLDFAWKGVRLPSAQLDALRVFLREEAGMTIDRNDDEGALVEFEIGGMDLHNYQQDFLVNGAVKLTFFTADEALDRVLSPGLKDKLRIAELSELFATKALVSAQRSKSRDWFDLHCLMRQHGFTIADYREAFVRAEIPTHVDLGLTRLSSGVPQKDDEGLAQLTENPPTVKEMADFFRKQRDVLEQSLAEQEFDKNAQE